MFESRKGPISLALSPPPNLRVPYLGPALLNMDKLTQRKREKRHKRFVDLRASEEEVVGQFSKTVRRRIRNNRDGDYAVETGGEAALRWVVDRVNERFTEQDESTPLTAEFGSRVRRWQGGVKPEVDLPVNELLE